jgi:hypothetical protein
MKEITEADYAKIEHLMPKPRKPQVVSNYDFLCALLYIVRNGCTWRALPEKYGKWHTIYMRFNRWAKKGIIERIFEELQNMNIIDNRTDLLCIDSTFIKVHPDGTGALKKTADKA